MLVETQRVCDSRRAVGPRWNPERHCVRTRGGAQAAAIKRYPDRGGCGVTEAEQRGVGNEEVVISVTSAEGLTEIGPENFPLHLEMRSG